MTRDAHNREGINAGFTEPRQECMTH